MVNLALMKELNVSFVEAGLLERIRYFSEYDENGSGWCYVGKLRLADEFGMSKVGLLKAIQRLIERNLLIKNEQGWLMVNPEGLTKFTGQQSLPVNKVNDRSKLSLPNNILEDSNSNIDSNSTLLLSKQSLPVNKVNSQQSLPAKVKPTKIKLTDEEFIQQRLDEGKKPLRLIECHFVYLKEIEYKKLLSRYKHKKILDEMILQYDAWKQNSTKGVQAYKSDYLALLKPWVFKNAIEFIKTQESPTVDNLRKREKVAEEMRSQTTFFNPPPPQLTNEQ
jgi:hemerythrin